MEADDIPRDMPDDVPDDVRDDEELLTRSARDPAAFEPLVTRHANVLHGYLTRRAPAAADDLLAEVWLRAYESRRSFDAARGTARTWLFGVARNVLAAHWRGTGRERSGAPFDRADTDPWQGVDERLDAAAVAPFLRHTIAGLPDAERELLLLVAWERLTPTEAAAVVGIPAGTARSRLHRARARLREAFASSTSTSGSDTARAGTSRVGARVGAGTLHRTGDPA